jgi:hypothetical protein
MLLVAAIKQLLTFADKNKVNKEKEEFQALLTQIEEELKQVIEFEKYVDKINEDLERKRKEFEEYKRLDENLIYSQFEDLENRSFSLTLSNIKFRKENAALKSDLDLYDSVIDVYEKQTNVSFEQIVKLIEVEAVKENLPTGKKLTEEEKLNKKEEAMRAVSGITKEDDLEIDDDIAFQGLV